MLVIIQNVSTAIVLFIIFLSTATADTAVYAVARTEFEKGQWFLTILATIVFILIATGGWRVLTFIFNSPRTG